MSSNSTLFPPSLLFYQPLCTDISAGVQNYFCVQHKTEIKRIQSIIINPELSKADEPVQNIKTFFWNPLHQFISSVLYYFSLLLNPFEQFFVIIFPPSLPPLSLFLPGRVAFHWLSPSKKKQQITFICKHSEFQRQGGYTLKDFFNQI